MRMVQLAGSGWRKWRCPVILDVGHIWPHKEGALEWA